MSIVRVLFDATWEAGAGGTARYVRSLREAMHADTGVVLLTMAAPRIGRGPRWLRAGVNGALHLGWTQVVLPWVTWRRKVDLLHCTMTAPMFATCPVVLTLHDALDFLPDLRPSRIWSLYMQTVGRWAASRADAVLCGTQASRDEIFRFYRLDPARVHVTRYGTSLHATDMPLGCKMKPYVQMVGVADRRKDIETGLRAVAMLRGEGIDLDAVVVGSVPDEFTGVGWVRVMSSVSDEELSMIYRQALVVLVPSRHEGFGLPVVEALALGTPVIASDLPALREVGGDVARYVRAGDVAKFARALAEVVNDPVAARAGVSAAQPEFRALTWAATAQATIARYRELLGAAI